jgi:hypothetical protein
MGGRELGSANAKLAMLIDHFPGLDEARLRPVRPSDVAVEAGRTALVNLFNVVDGPSGKGAGACGLVKEFLLRL